MKRRQQDALLENIIKESLLLELKSVGKLVRTTNEDMKIKQTLGAEFVFAVVTKRYTEKQLANVIASIAIASGAKDKPDDTFEDIGVGSKYATAEFNEYQQDLDSKALGRMPKYYYLYGNMKQIGQRYRITVCIMDSNKTIPYRQKHLGGGDDGDVMEYEGKTSWGKVGNARIQSMKSLLTYINDFIENICYDKTWYSKNNVGMKYPPAAWYEFAGMTQPAAEFTVQQILNQKCDYTWEEEPSTDNVQDDIQEVTDKEVGPSTFTGTWNNTKGHPVSGQMTIPHPDGVIVKDGTWTYDINLNDYWLSQGTKKYPNGDYYKGTFDANKFLDGEYYQIGTPYTNPDSKRMYKITTGYKQGGKIDTTKQFKVSQFDATTKKEVAYYEGTVDENLNANNGTVFEDSTKTTELGTYTNGEWIAK
jgi:hypothetical protein